MDRVALREDTGPHAGADADDPEGALGLTTKPDDVFDTDLRRDRWLISKVPGQPFILSTTHPDTLAEEQDLAVKSGADMGAIFGAVAPWALWVRL